MLDVGAGSPRRVVVHARRGGFAWPVEHDEGPEHRGDGVAVGGEADEAAVHALGEGLGNAGAARAALGERGRAVGTRITPPRPPARPATAHASRSMAARNRPGVKAATALPHLRAQGTTWTTPLPQSLSFTIRSSISWTA